MRYFYGIDIGGTEIKIGLFTESIKLIQSFSVATPQQNQDNSVLRKVYDEITKKNKELGITLADIAGVGVAVPGPIKNDILLKGANVKFKNNTNIKEELGKYFEMPIDIQVGNDASLAAYGEYRLLDIKYDNVVFYTLGTGVGGGIIIDGKLLEGFQGCASEIGHMMVSENIKEKCGCGQYGCLEQICSGKGMVSFAKKILTKESGLNKHIEITPKVIFDEAKLGDEISLLVVNRMAHYLALSLSTLSVVLNPEIFIFGGGISAAGQYLIDLVEKHFKQIARFKTRETKLVLARLGNDAGIYGAAYFVKRQERLD